MVFDSANMQHNFNS